MQRSHLVVLGTSIAMMTMVACGGEEGLDGAEWNDPVEEEVELGHSTQAVLSNYWNVRGTLTTATRARPYSSGVVQYKVCVSRDVYGEQPGFYVSSRGDVYQPSGNGLVAHNVGHSRNYFRFHPNQRGTLCQTNTYYHNYGHSGRALIQTEYPDIIDETNESDNDDASILY